MPCDEVSSPETPCFPLGAPFTVRMVLPVPPAGRHYPSCRLSQASGGAHGGLHELPCGALPGPRRPAITDYVLTTGLLTAE